MINLSRLGVSVALVLALATTAFAIGDRLEAGQHTLTGNGVPPETWIIDVSSGGASFTWDDCDFVFNPQPPNDPDHGNYVSNGPPPKVFTFVAADPNTSGVYQTTAPVAPNNVGTYTRP